MVTICLSEQTEDSSEPVITEFKDRLERSEEGRHQSGLICKKKTDVPDLPTTRTEVKQDFTSFFKDSDSGKR